MFNSPILDLVILLSFTYFVGSLMLTAINESISAGLKTRAKDLKVALENLLFDGDWKKFAKDKVFASQHIKSLMKNQKQFPSYIPAQNFVLTIIEQIKSENFTKANVLKGIEEAKLPDAMKNVLKDLWAKAQANTSVAQNELASFEKGIENFYNNAMDRASGWYKRKTRRIIIVTGFILSAILNIDTIKITNDALSDKSRLAKTVDNIIASLPDLSKDESIKINAGNDTIRITHYNHIDTLVKSTATKIKDLQIIYDERGGYQMGYGKGKYFNDWWADKNGVRVFLLKILGLLITAFALQLGSNYWFDLLNKTVNLRATGKKPDEKSKSN